MRVFLKATATLFRSVTICAILAFGYSSAVAEETNKILVDTNADAMTLQNGSSVRTAFDQERAENWELEHEADGVNVKKKGAERLPVSRLAVAISILGVTTALASLVWQQRASNAET